MLAFFSKLKMHLFLFFMIFKMKYKKGWGTTKLMFEINNFSVANVGEMWFILSIVARLMLLAIPGANFEENPELAGTNALSKERYFCFYG